MNDDFEKLLADCQQQMEDSGYSYAYMNKIIQEWNLLKEWLTIHDATEFNEDVAFKYCDETIGNHIIYDGISNSDKLKLRAVRMLTTFNKCGSFEFRSPRVEKKFTGKVGNEIIKFISYCIEERYLAPKTIENYRGFLFSFNEFINIRNIDLDDLSVEKMEKFMNGFETLSMKHNVGGVVRQFLRYEYETGTTDRDCSIFCPRDNYKKNCKLPTTYTEEEIKAVVNAVERGSAIGKRDYLIILLSAEFGLRSSDITNLTFDNIDWDNNNIILDQHKTGETNVYPLLANVGNAIIDYLKNGRPVCDTPQIIVSHNHTTLGQPLTSPTMHSIVTKYMKAAEIKDWEKKRHGTHALRHSLASNMLARNVSMPIISTVIGHQSTETTKIYLSIDYDSLKKCALPMPPLHSPFYPEEDDYDNQK